LRVFSQRHRRSKTRRSARPGAPCWSVAGDLGSEIWRHRRRTRSANRTRCARHRWGVATVGTVDVGCPIYPRQTWRWLGYSGQRLQTPSAASAWCEPWWISSSKFTVLMLTKRCLKCVSNHFCFGSNKTQKVQV